MHSPAAVLASTFFVLAASYATPAEAVEVMRFHSSHGVANCQSALPVFDAQMRKRPKALANEGDRGAFVTCDSEQLTRQFSQVFHVALGLINRNAASVDVSCTLVDGIGYESFGPYLPETVALAPNVLSGIGWGPADNNGNRYSAPAISCHLPPGVEIAVTEFAVFEDIGD